MVISKPLDRINRIYMIYKICCQLLAFSNLVPYTVYPKPYFIQSILLILSKKIRG
jgi:hypothetical protein